MDNVLAENENANTAEWKHALSGIRAGELMPSEALYTAIMPLA
jgi:hypothetical protein